MNAGQGSSVGRRAALALLLAVGLTGALVLALLALPAGVSRVHAGPRGADLALPADAGTTFVFGRAVDSIRLDPALVTDGESFRVTGQCLEPLYQYEPGGTTPDGTVWTCTLRQGVWFHDGTPFNAAAVVWNFQRWRLTDHPYHLPGQVFEYYEYIWGGFDDAGIISSVTALDEYTVRFTLTTPLAPFLANLAMDAFAISSPAAIQASGADYGLPASGCAGTGPFAFVEWVPGDHITVAANDGYWAGRPPVDYVTWRVIADDAARFQALQAGAIQAMEPAAAADLAAAEADPALYVAVRPALNTAYLAFNYNILEMRDPNFRRAVVHAIDRQGLVQDYFGGYGHVASNFLPPLVMGHNDAIADWPYDPALARQFLADGGFPDPVDEVTVAEDVRDSQGNLVYTKGQKIPLRLYYMPIERFYYPRSEEVGAAMVADLQAAGLNATLELAGDWPTYLGLRRDGLLMGLYQLGWGGDNGDPDNFLGSSFGYSAGDRDPGVPPEDWVKSPDPREGWYANTQVAQLCYQASVNPDQAERQVMYEQAEQLLHDDVARLWVAHNSSPLILAREVGGYVPQPVGADYYERLVLGSEWADVTPDDPATLVYDDPLGGSSTVEVPAGAVTEAVTLLYQPLTDVEAAGGLLGALGFLLEAHVDGELATGLTFNIPLTLTIDYTDAEIAGLNEGTLEVRVWNGLCWSTDGITVVSRDPAHNRIVVTVAHLSEFALVGRDVNVAHRIHLPLVQHRAAAASPARDLPAGDTE